ARGGMFYHQNGVPGPKGNAAATKSGRGCNYSVLWLAAWGDSSIDSIREDSGISKVGSVDYDETAILGFFFHRFCTTVMGE
ncbi:MAG TPA: TRL-like family protein, partial [Leptospiraceae bacterium]|nr:TRL-like family protein [Leptospiraceae bacterium]